MFSDCENQLPTRNQLNLYSAFLHTFTSKLLKSEHFFFLKNNFILLFDNIVIKHKEKTL